MESPPSPNRITPYRRKLGLAGLAATALAVVAATRMIAPSCPAQADAAGMAQPGLILLAGDSSNPACTGKHKLRQAHAGPLS